ncbi:MAG: AtpZ/AtpI family protein [Nitrospinota bacterium]
MNNNKKNRVTQARKLYLLSSIGIQIIVSILIGLIIGVWLDGKLETKPIFTLIFIFFGVVAGFLNLYRVTKKIVSKDER